MNENSNRSRPRRTFSAFGDVRKMPSEYEIVTHGQNWTMRDNRPSAFEQNPSSPPNLWFLTYRDQSPLQAENWEQFREPDSLTYRMYVNAQAESQTVPGLKRLAPSTWKSARTTFRLTRPWLAP